MEWVYFQLYACNMSPVYSFAVWNTIMGSSLLTMPWGVQNAGLLMGIITIVLMGGLCLYTTHKILQVQMRHGKSDFRYSFNHVHAWWRAEVEQQGINQFLSIVVFRVVTQCCLQSGDQCFGGMHRLHLHDWNKVLNPENGGDVFLQNVGNHLHDNIMSQPRITSDIFSAVKILW
jgi:hypothetical protein